MTATITQVENAFAALLSQLGRVVVQGRIGEDGAPSTPYAMWSLESIEIGDFPIRELSSNQQRIIATGTPLVFLVNICGGADAHADAVRFALSFRQSQRLNELYALCGLSGISELRNLSAVEVGNFRQRIEMRVTLFAALELSAAPELIETSCVEVIEATKEFDEIFCVTEGECR